MPHNGGGWCVVNLKTRINPKDEALFLWVPSGTFIMGSRETEVRKFWDENQWDERWLRGQVKGNDWVGVGHGKWTNQSI